MRVRDVEVELRPPDAPPSNFGSSGKSVGRSGGYRELHLGDRSCLDSAGTGVTPIVFRHSGWDFRGMGVHRSDEGLGKGASQRSWQCGPACARSPVSFGEHRPWHPSRPASRVISGPRASFPLLSWRVSAAKPKSSWKCLAGFEPFGSRNSFRIKRLKRHPGLHLPTDSTDEALFLAV